MNRPAQVIETMSLSTIAGVDEAGRGPLAGPVVAAAVVLPDDFPLSGLKDSKLLNVKQRNYFFALIKTKALAIGTAMVESEEIDRLNILQATLKAMALSIERLNFKPQTVLIDGNRTIPNLAISQQALVKGDTFHPSIMCAGIVAKVVRDRWMTQIHRQYPQYGFRIHKGYGTPSHLKALFQFGPSPIHRNSFAPVQLAQEAKNRE